MILVLYYLLIRHNCPWKIIQAIWYYDCELFVAARKNFPYDLSAIIFAKVSYAATWIIRVAAGGCHTRSRFDLRSTRYDKRIDCVLSFYLTTWPSKSRPNVVGEVTEFRYNVTGKWFSNFWKYYCHWYLWASRADNCSKASRADNYSKASHADQRVITVCLLLQGGSLKPHLPRACMLWNLILSTQCMKN